ncbi:BrnT family toxin [Sandarakinorhabdus glacialis]|nr:BrnT family toxin [Polymorphobacter glacialis]
MELSWDENKREVTWRKRNLDFADAAKVFAGFNVDHVDDRFD